MRIPSVAVVQLAKAATIVLERTQKASHQILQKRNGQSLLKAQTASLKQIVHEYDQRIAPISSGAIHAVSNVFTI